MVPLPKHAALSLLVALLVACSSTSAPSNDSPSAPDSGVASPVEADAAAPDEPSDAGADHASKPPRDPGPSFTVPASALAIANEAAPANQSSAYLASSDPAAPEGGKPSTLLASTADATPTGFAATTATRAIDETYVGRRYRMRAKIKTEDATKGWLWWRIDSPGHLDLDNMGYPVDRTIKGTNDWQEVSLVLDVPEEATRFAFGSGLIGTGKVWVGAITFEEVGTGVPTTPHFSGATK